MNLRDALAVTKINRMKIRVREALARKAAEAPAAPADRWPICEGCGERHPPVRFSGLATIIARALAEGDDDEKEGGAPPKNTH